MKTIEMNGFAGLNGGKSSGRRFITGRVARVETVSPGVSGILTPLKSKTPYITTKKNKKSSNPVKLVISGLSRIESPGIAYIAVKKIIKSLTFNFSCARNTLVMKMKLTYKRRYLWLF